ncbi:UNVERIFIED_CONTAM: LMBR1 domain-containing protein 2 [Siphonaria sp. JEL0065]|nr:LMBR1 domain-containing protein 2 [Siphonaria sp. JEL0065]
MMLAVLLLVVLAVFVAALLCYFGDVRRFPWYAQLFSFVGWYFPFAIILILPLDLASTLHTKCQIDNIEQDPDICQEPLAYVTADFLLVFWKIVYWTSQLLCWFVIPIMGTYVRSGDFRLSTRLYNAVKDNMFYYLLMGIGGAAFLIYMLFAVKFTKEALIAVLMAAANAWGLLLCTCMLGYGLVEVPRFVWNLAIPAQRLKALEMKVPKTREKMIDSEAEMYEVARAVASANHKVPDGDPLRVHVELLLKKCPLALDEKVQADIDRRKEVTEQTLRDLHARIKYSGNLCSRHQAQYRFLLEKAWFLGDVVENQKSKDYVFRSVYFKAGTSPLDVAKLRILWVWYIWLRPIIIRLFSIIFILASIALIWSESTFQITALPLSIPALLIKNNFVSYASLEFIAISFLIYMCTCAYSTLFRINIFDYYVIVPEHCTDEPSMLFVGGYLCRLTFPLCYNFLNMVGDDQNSVFIEFQGKAIDLAPLLGSGFNDWVPLLVLIFSVITYFDLFGRIASACCFGRKIVNGKDEGHEADAIEGRSVIAQARSIEERRSGGAFSSNPDRLRTGPGMASTVLNTKELLAKYNRGGAGGATGAIGSSNPSSVNGVASRAPNANSNTLSTNTATPPVTNTSAFAGFGLNRFGFGSKSAVTATAGTGKYQKLGDDGGDETEQFIQQPPTITAPSDSGFSKIFSGMGGGKSGAGSSSAVAGESGGKSGGGGRVFGKSENTSGNPSPALSRQSAFPSPTPTPKPTPVSAPIKKRNMFDDL